MERKVLLLVVVLVALGLTTSAMALAPMGPPTAGLKTGQFRAGFDYSISETDIKTEWDNGDEIWKDVQSNLFAANIGYGISDDWEIFTRLGVANAKYDKYEVGGVTYDMEPAFNGDYGFLFGLGTKVTFLKQENLNWGALFQIHWLNSKDTLTESGVEVVDGDETWTDEAKIKVKAYEIQVAVGPTWKVNEALSIYGGPFFHFIGGDVDLDWREITDGVLTDSGSESADLKEKSCFGGYVGAQLDLKPSPSEVTNAYYLFGEFQFTGDALAFATGIGWKF